MTLYAAVHTACTPLYALLSELQHHEAFVNWLSC